jgi:hypothetical protein
MKAALPEPESITKKDKPVSVILPIKRYQEILERLEDAEDVAWLKMARRKKLHCLPSEDLLTDRNELKMYRVVVEWSPAKDLKHLSGSRQHRFNPSLDRRGALGRISAKEVPLVSANSLMIC